MTGVFTIRLAVALHTVALIPHTALTAVLFVRPVLAVLCAVTFELAVDAIAILAFELLLLALVAVLLVRVVLALGSIVALPNQWDAWHIAAVTLELVGFAGGRLGTRLLVLLQHQVDRTGALGLAVFSDVAQV